MINKIKELRVKLDGLTQLTKSLKGENIILLTGEVSLAITSLHLSKMWLGKVLKELGNANPYPDSKTPIKYRTSSIIESTHGEIPQGTESIRVNGNEAVFLIHEAEVTFIMDKDTLNGYFEIVPNEKIEPTADRTYTNYSEVLSEQNIDWRELSHIQKVKWLRAEIEKIEIELKEIGRTTTRRSWIAENLLNSINYTIEAGMWLGMELGRVRDNEIKEAEIKERELLELILSKDKESEYFIYSGSVDNNRTIIILSKELCKSKDKTPFKDIILMSEEEAESKGIYKLTCDIIERQKAIDFIINKTNK